MVRIAAKEMMQGLVQGPRSALVSLLDLRQQISHVLNHKYVGSTYLQYEPLYILHEEEF